MSLQNNKLILAVKETISSTQKTS